MNLTLSEELLLLAIDDERGCDISDAQMTISYALAGALIFELVELGVCRIEGKYLIVESMNERIDSVLEVALEVCRKTNQPKPIKWHIEHLAHKNTGIKRKLVGKLIQKGILELKETRVLWVFSVERYPTKDDAPENAVRQRLREVVLKDVIPSERDCVLLSLICVSHLEKEVFHKEELEDAVKRMKSLLAESKVGTVVSELISEIQIALTVVMAAAVTVAVNA